MPSSFFLLSRAPCLGTATLLSRMPKLKKEAREAQKYLFAFLDAIQVFPDAVYARKEPPNKWTVPWDQEIAVLSVLLEVGPDHTASAMGQLGCHKVEDCLYTTLYQCLEMSDEIMTSRGYSLVKYSKAICAEFKAQTPQLMAVIHSMHNRLGYEGPSLTVPKPPADVLPFLHYDPSSISTRIPLSQGMGFPFTIRPDPSPFAITPAPSFVPITSTMKRSPSPETSDKSNPKRQRVNSPVLTDSTLIHPSDAASIPDLEMKGAAVEDTHEPPVLSVGQVHESGTKIDAEGFKYKVIMYRAR
ncbi:hypothetical protein BS47DRAFT_1362047 [Hydnum rufescens UP504]|uniref:Uncharacterized protein n=1 Tax=Hydnum rufescens UP504 TaxID=1448309 RepID=A0A9P6AXS1_9AGAM|nr:hypothetical protein BS47DRAFT_1362047 [Hydnum rufescens UP504]